MRMKHTLVGMMTAIVLALSGPVEAGAQSYKEEYRVSTVLPSPFPWGMAAEAWVRLVNERTDGRIRMKLYPGAQLVSGEQTREFAALRRGIIDMAVGSTINWSPQIMELNLFALPFLMRGHDDLDALTGGPVGDRLFEIIRAGGVEPLAWAENGFREVTNARLPIRRPEDLAGLKIRVVGSPLFTDIFSALGANPTQMSWADAQPALATGAVDGQENPLSVYTTLKMHELGQTHVTLWHYVADPLILAVNRSVWETFTPEDREIVRQAAIDAGRIGIEAARAGSAEDDTALVGTMEAQGITVVRLSDAEREAFVAATRGVYEDWKRRIGEDLVRMAEEAVAVR